MSVKQTEGKITALYERLSRDDEQVGDSSSVARFPELRSLYGRWLFRRQF